MRGLSPSSSTPAVKFSQNGRRGGILLALIAAFVWLPGCARLKPVLKVGLVAPFEGRHRDLGYDVIYSARLAVREANEAGGIHGYAIALVSLDDGGEADLAKGAAASMVVDPDVVAVVGHWLPETTVAAAAVYAEGGLPFIQAGKAPFEAVDPDRLPENFRASYQMVSPFDEAAGPYAAAAYDAFQLLWLAVGRAAGSGLEIDRSAVATALNEVEYRGMSGTVVYWRDPRLND